MQIVYADHEHKTFYCAMLRMCGQDDPYHRSFFYTTGISEITRLHIGELYNLQERAIIRSGLYCGWHTGVTTRLTRLAFNLFNGWVEEGQERYSSPYYLFDCEYGRYFMDAIKLRYPEFCFR